MQLYRMAQSSGIRLWLDDERNPRDPIIQTKYGAKGDELWVKTPPEAIQILSQGNVSFISFDHDLGINSAGASPNGTVVANWIERAAYGGRLKRLAWNVHSENPVGKAYITKAMESAERFWDEQEILENK